MTNETKQDWEDQGKRSAASTKVLQRMLIQAEREKQLVYLEYCDRSLEIERAISDIENRLDK